MHLAQISSSDQINPRGAMPRTALLVDSEDKRFSSFSFNALAALI